MSCCWEGQADVAETSNRIAKKTHHCDACGESITPGMHYAREAVLYDGRWDITKRCARCEAIYQVLLYNDKGGSWDEGIDRSLSCGHTYEEVWGKEPPDMLSSLAFMHAKELEDIILVLQGFTDGMRFLGTQLCT